MRAICSAKYVYKKGVITGRTQKPSLFFKVLNLYFNQESKVNMHTYSDLLCNDYFHSK